MALAVVIVETRVGRRFFQWADGISLENRRLTVDKVISRTELAKRNLSMESNKPRRFSMDYGLDILRDHQGRFLVFFIPKCAVCRPRRLHRFVRPRERHYLTESPIFRWLESRERCPPIEVCLFLRRDRRHEVPARRDVT